MINALERESLDLFDWMKSVTLPNIRECFYMSCFNNHLYKWHERELFNLAIAGYHFKKGTIGKGLAEQFSPFSIEPEYTLDLEYLMPALTKQKDRVDRMVGIIKSKLLVLGDITELDPPKRKLPSGMARQVLRASGGTGVANNVYKTYRLGEGIPLFENVSKVMSHVTEGFNVIELASLSVACKEIIDDLAIKVKGQYEK
jgi:hypothetical protein